MNATLKRWVLWPFNIMYKLCPVSETKLLFVLKTGHRLNLKNPKTFNEKLQWIKLFDRNERKPQCVDKYTVRNFIKERGCGEILNSLLWQGFDPKDIPFDNLPEKFVIKVTHGQGMNIICKNKAALDKKKTVKILKKWLRTKYLPCYGEWFYGVIRPRIIIEKFLGDENDQEPIDYKIFCFNGEPKLIDVHTGRFIDHKRNFYDLEWNVIKGVGIKYPTDENEVVPKPDELDLMLEYARRLSKPFIHVRVDLYIVNNKVYFGELTFTNGAGFDKVYPKEFDIKLGSYIDIKSYVD